MLAGNDFDDYQTEPGPVRARLLGLSTQPPKSLEQSWYVVDGDPHSLVLNSHGPFTFQASLELHRYARASRRILDGIIDEVQYRRPEQRAFTRDPGFFAFDAADALDLLGPREWPCLVHHLPTKVDQIHRTKVRRLQIVGAREQHESLGQAQRTPHAAFDLFEQTFFAQGCWIGAPQLQRRKHRCLWSPQIVRQEAHRLLSRSRCCLQGRNVGEVDDMTGKFRAAV